MNNKYKILAAVSLAVLVVPFGASAQSMTVSQLQAEIQSLTSQLSTLQAQLASAEGSSAGWCYTFNTNLEEGMSGSSVTALQTALQKDGETVSITGTFDDQTASAVTGFQQKYASVILTPSGLQYGTGYVGKATRAELNSLFGCSGSSNNNNNPVTVTPPIIAYPIEPTSSSPVACPMYVPYCPYGSQSVMGINGCTQTICNQAPATSTPSAVPSITRIDPASNLTPGGAVTLDGTNFDSASTLDLDGNQTINPGAYASNYFDFMLPNNITAGTHTLMIVEKGSGVTSNQIVFTVSAPSQSVVTVIAPISGATWSQGSSEIIQWQTAVAGDPTDVGINLLQNGTGVVAIGNVPNTGWYDWTVPNTFSGSNFQIQIYGEGGYGDSAMFSISTPTAPVAPPSVPSITRIDSASNLTPGGAVTLDGSNFDSASTVELDGTQTINPGAYTSTYVDFMLPSNITLGTHTLMIVEKASSIMSNQIAFTVTSASTTTPPVICPAWGCNGPNHPSGSVQ